MKITQIMSTTKFVSAHEGIPFTYFFQKSTQKVPNKEWLRRKFYRYFQFQVLLETREIYLERKLFFIVGWKNQQNPYANSAFSDM